MSRKKIVAGNWKMNKNLYEGKQLVSDIIKRLELIECPKCLIVIAPPFTQLELAAHQIEGKQPLYLAAQNCHQEKNGAYTGEISAEMLKSVGVDFVILGHSERRLYFGEDEEILRQKIDAVLSKKLKVIYCVGESKEIREANQQNELVKKQIEGALFHLSEKDIDDIVIAYEPVWAIGTGLTASAEQAQEMHKFIRSTIAEKYGESTADKVSILYGGSCKPDNAAEIFAGPDVDGGLIGGAALNADDFMKIVSHLG